MSCVARCLFIVLAAAAGSLAAAPAKAGTLGAHVVSHHFPNTGYNNINPGLYYRMDEGAVAGFYRNSLRRTSVYVGYTWQYKQFDVTVGAVTNYLRAVQPLLVPSVKLFTYEGYSTRLAFIPQVEKRIGSHVLHLMVEH
ncbi:MAG: hypothetical protein RLZZ618_1473 [Pseudomonadota bacterium]|jgi:hypothetical protein